MEGFLPEPVLTFLNGARNLGVSLSWSISSSQEKKSVLLEWNTQPEKCSTGKSGKSQKSPCRRRRDAQRHQVWKEKRERTSDSTHRNPQEVSKGPDKEVLNPESRISTEAKQKRLRHRKRRRQRPATVDLASPHRDQNIIPAVCTISLKQNRSRTTTETQTDRQVTTSCATQTAHPGVTSKGVQALCPVPSHTRSTQCETVNRSSTASQTWIVTCDQNTQSVGSNPQPSIRQLNPRCVESNGLEFPDQTFIDSLVRERTDPGELPTLPKIYKKNFPNNNKTVTLKVSYGQQTYERGMWQTENLVSDKLCLIKQFQLFGTYPSACYLLTKHQGQHYIVPDSGLCGQFKQLKYDGLLLVTLLIYDYERGRYVQPDSHSNNVIKPIRYGKF